jgi:hypothetical protein
LPTASKEQISVACTRPEICLQQPAQPSCTIINLTLTMQMLVSLIIFGMRPKLILQWNRQEINQVTGLASLSPHSERKLIRSMRHSWWQDLHQKTAFFNRLWVHKYHFQVHAILYIIILKCKLHLQQNCFPTEWTGLSVPFLARSDSRKIYLFN